MKISKLVKLRKKFSTLTSGVSNDMLVSLSLSHFDSKTFDSNSKMVNFLKEKNMITFSETQKTMEKLDREIFLGSEKTEKNPYSLKAHNFVNGVDVTNPMMQAIILDCVWAGLKSFEKTEKIDFLDVGCATGFLTFGAKVISDDDIKVTGIDIDEKSVDTAREINEKKFGFEKINFAVDDIFTHLGTFQDYNFVVSGCGLTHSDIIGSVLGNLKNDEECVILAPVFTSGNQQSLRVHFPLDLEEKFLENFSKIKLFSELKSQKINEMIGAIDLFTCFFTPLTYPNFGQNSSKKLKLNLKEIGIKEKDLNDFEGEGREDFDFKKLDFKKMNLGEIKEMIEEKEAEFKKNFFELKKTNQNLTLEELNRDDKIKKLLEDINLLKRYKKSKELV